MRSGRVAVALLLLSLSGACDESAHAPWLVRFPSDAPRGCSALLEVWILRGGCADGLPEVFRSEYGARVRPGPIQTLEPGRYGFGARARDAAGNWFADGCTEVTLPLEDGQAIEVMLTRSATPLDCGAADGGVDAAVDAGPPMDSGMRDAGTDAGPPSCEASMVDARLTLGCNGPIRGPAADNEFGGWCAVSVDPRGTCHDPVALCLTTEPRATEGVCLYECPEAPTYVSQGGCPTGSRCLTFGPGDAFCFPDCAANEDCALGVCLSDGTCE